MIEINNLVTTPVYSAFLAIMLTRRSFILSLGAITLGQILSGCNRNSREELKVKLLKDSIPPQLLKEFRQQLQQPVKLQFRAQSQLQNLFNQLQIWHQQTKTENNNSPWRRYLPINQPPLRADLVTLGDYWLDIAIKEGLIRPLPVNQLKKWDNLPSKWQTLVTRNEKVWGAPYRWGATVIAYRRDKFQALGWTPTDWSDLWREELRHRFSLLNQPREVIGLTLKKLDKSYNTNNLEQVTELKQQLQQLNRQVKFYSSDAYLQPLILGDTWLAMGWSTDILSIQQRYRDIEVVVPSSGTALWADLWVQPSSVEKLTAVTAQWIDFCWQQKPAQKISLLTDAISPLIAVMNPELLSPSVQENPLIKVEPAILERSEFLQPLSEQAMAQYRNLWQEIRTTP